MAWKNPEIPFDSVSELAYIIVDDVIKSAVQVVTEESAVPVVPEEQPKTEERPKEAGPNIYHLNAFGRNLSVRMLKSESYRISHWTAERRRSILCINKKTWELHKSWLHWINYLDEEELQYSTRYHYRVRWSIPTCRKPIPRATANVYFIIEISKIKPVTLPVEVFFVVETNRFIHRPGECRFKEKWLKDVIESKVTLMETVNF